MRDIIKKILLLSILLSTLISAETCPDMNKLFGIIRELNNGLKINFCKNELGESQMAWLKTAALPQLLNKSFLGVEPPPNWQGLVDELFTDCYQKGDLCNQTIQSEFSQCAMGKLPFIMFQINPWMNDNCRQVNQAVIEHWQDKKSVIMKLYNEYNRKFITVQ